MQYEIVILELLTRIKKLENDVSELKQLLNNLSLTSNKSDKEITNENNYKNDPTANKKYIKLTDDMINICYNYGKRAFNGESIQELSDIISNSTGMNKNSAVIYLYAVCDMLNGTIYKRNISLKAIKKYYDNILNDYGKSGLKKAIQSTRLNIEYRKKCGHNIASMEKICNKYEKKLYE